MGERNILYTVKLPPWLQIHFGCASWIITSMRLKWEEQYYLYNILIRKKTPQDSITEMAGLGFCVL